MIDISHKEASLDKKSFHLAGIVPIAGQPLEFKYPWHPSLNPIGPDYFSIQRAIYECAMAGCETIWVVCHMGTQPLIRKTVGEWIHDPVSVDRAKRLQEKIKRIQIYYVPIHPKDRQKRDCLGWSALYGALSAYWLGRKLSRWVIPEMFYVAFPYGVYPVEFLRPNRLDISSGKKVTLTYEGKSIKDGLPLGFSFSGEDFKKCRAYVRKESSSSMYYPNGRRIPFTQGYQARFYPLEKVFHLYDDSTSIKLDTPWFYDISTWQGYRNYLASDKELIRPDEVKYHQWNNIDYYRQDKETDKE